MWFKKKEKKLVFPKSLQILDDNPKHTEYFKNSKIPIELVDNIIFYYDIKKDKVVLSNESYILKDDTSVWSEDVITSFINTYDIEGANKLQTTSRKLIMYVDKFTREDSKTLRLKTVEDIEEMYNKNERRNLIEKLKKQGKRKNIYANRKN